MASPSGFRSSHFAAAAGPAHAVALALTLLVVVIAPLAVGSVHKNSMLVVAGLAATAFMAMGLATWGTGRSFRGARYTWPLALLVAFPLLQVISLPMSLRGLIDPAGNLLLQNAPPPPFARFPLSLDPLTTRIEILRAAVALVVFLVCLNLSSGRSGQGPLILKAVAAAAVLGVVVGIGHPLLNFERIYGHWRTGVSPVLIGPFVNPNHTAQFFELGAFTAVACAFFTSDRLARGGWLGAGALCAAAALVTLSRASLIALVAGGAATLWLLPGRQREAEGPPHGRDLRLALPIALGIVGTTGALAVALGAMPLLDEIGRTQVGQPGEKTEVWLDALKVLWAHPAGIGRGAFNRVFPAYRTVAGATQQNFVENEPLQMLLELGWPGFAALVAALAYVALIVRRRRLRDGAEAAMVGGLVALLAHNMFDFGLETIGIRVPLVAVAGVLVGRLLGGRRPSGAGASRTWLPVATAVGGLILGLMGLASAKPYDDLLRQTQGLDRARLAKTAARTHPTDYFFPLIQSTAEPLRENAKSPRLATLNRATRLCPNCANVHRATAATLWQLGRTEQALLEYRLAMDLDVFASTAIVEELYKAGAAHDQVARLRPTKPAAAHTVAHVLVHRQASGEAPRVALAHAHSVGVNSLELALLRIELAFNEDDTDAAAINVKRVLRVEPRSARALYLKVVVQDRQGDAKAALQTAIAASGYNPEDVPLARQRVQLAMRLEEWAEVERGLEALKGALQASGSNIAYAYLISAEAHHRRRNLPRALRDYQTATSIEPENIHAWFALGALAEEGGFYSQALDAYRAVLRLQPDHPGADAGLQRIQAVRQQSRLDALIGGPR